MKKLICILALIGLSIQSFAQTENQERVQNCRSAAVNAVTEIVNANKEFSSEGYGLYVLGNIHRVQDWILGALNSKDAALEYYVFTNGNERDCKVLQVRGMKTTSTSLFMRY